MKAAGLALSAALIASPAFAGTIAVRPMTAAPLEQQAVAQLKGGALCLKAGLATASEMRHAIEGGGFDTRLREELSRAGTALDTTGAAAIAVSGVARIPLVNVCLPLWGLDNIDTISGTVEVAVDWTLSDRPTGAEVGRLSTRELLQRKTGPGGLAGMVLEAFAGNARALAANPAFQQAAARPPLSAPKPAPAVARNPAGLVVEPWRRTPWKSGRPIAVPQIIESDLDMFDTGDSLTVAEYFAVQMEAGETLKLEVLDASKALGLRISDDTRTRLIVETSRKSPERQLSATAPQAGTYLVEIFSKGNPPNAAYRVRVETDRRPYRKPEPPKPLEPPKPSEVAKTNPQPQPTPAKRPPFAPPVFLK